MSRRQQAGIWFVVLLGGLIGLGWVGVVTDQWAWFVGGLIGCIVGLVLSLRWRHFYTRAGREAQSREDDDEQGPSRAG